jgi:diadenosine tetraphosphatase ApaH/serine/threonine PP2A family protein phosphatase
MALGATSVRGNHDRYLVEQEPEAKWPSDRIAHAQLDQAAHLDWLRSLAVTACFRDMIYLCHATPANDEVYGLETVMPDGAVRLSSIKAIGQAALGIEQSLILCGHSHIPRAIRLRNGRMVVNPGSVGGPRLPRQCAVSAFDGNRNPPMPATPFWSCARVIGR